MHHRFLQISFSFAERLKIEELESTMTAIGDDWIRFSALCWILWTDKPAIHVFTLLEPKLDKGDNIFIQALYDGDAPLGRESYAVFPRWIWDWLNSKKAGYVSYGPEIEALKRLPATAFEAKKD
ncbi:MAG TPA: hypothetical protein VGH02_13445 [Rhizomicrobium sp.]|jgi:hypothetical protein